MAADICAHDCQHSRTQHHGGVAAAIGFSTARQKCITQHSTDPPEYGLIIDQNTHVSAAEGNITYGIPDSVQEIPLEL